MLDKPRVASPTVTPDARARARIPAPPRCEVRPCGAAAAPLALCGGLRPFASRSRTRAPERPQDGLARAGGSVHGPQPMGSGGARDALGVGLVCGGAACLGVLSVRLSTPCRVYQARKNANEGKGDIVFKQLQYVPTCTHMVRRLTPARAQSSQSTTKRTGSPPARTSARSPPSCGARRRGAEPFIAVCPVAAW